MRDVKQPLRWLEVSADYRCNNRCIGCYSVQDEGPSMSAREVAETLLVGRQSGAKNLWLGGGEPTLRKDLFAAVKKARELGYERIKLQTNGMLLAYPEFVERLVESGVSEVNFAIKGAVAETHDRLTRTPGCHALMLEGMSHVKRHGLPMEGDLLIYRSNARELPEMVRVYRGHGVARFNVWLFSATDQGDRDLSAQVPKISELMPELVRAREQFPEAPADFVTSLHTPPCTVPEAHHGCLFHAAELGLMVANPGGYRFMLEESAIEGGSYLERCTRCGMRERCGGLRQDYLAIHGDAEFSPVPPARERP